MKSKYNEEMEHCKDRLMLLNYLRISQCTLTIFSKNNLNGLQLAPNKYECEKTLQLMEEEAKKCIEMSRNR
ncbi:MAG: hypothetical protein H0U70_01030 [Tatlockia sp.]|nr:hypothetical protein [Tatlockia sp.]